MFICIVLREPTKCFQYLCVTNYDFITGTFSVLLYLLCAVGFLLRKSESAAAAALRKHTDNIIVIIIAIVAIATHTGDSN